MSNVPPPPYPANGQGTQWVLIDGTKYYPFGTSGYGNPSPAFSQWPTSALDTIAQWEITAKKSDPNKWSDFSMTVARNWLSKHDQTDGVGVASQYATYAANGGGSPAPTVGTLPGEGTATNAIGSTVDFLKLLTSANLWLRVAEVALGVVLIGVAIVKIGAPGAKFVKSTPIGKLA